MENKHRPKFRFVVKGTFEIEVDAESQDEARVAVWRAVDSAGVGSVTLETAPSRDWQILKGGAQ